MEHAGRLPVTAGIAVLTAGLIVAAPATPALLAGAPLLPDVQLTSLDDTAGNLTHLVDGFSTAAPLLQQILHNQFDNLGTLLADPSKLGDILTGVGDNFGDAVGAPFAADTDAMDSAHHSLFSILHGATSGDDLTGGLVDFTASPLSGLMLGAVGPLLGPLVALSDGVTGLFDAGNPDAFGDVLKIPETMLDAFLNGGQVLDVTGLLGGLLGGLGIGGVNQADVGLALGGLFSPAGSLFGALDMTLLPGTANPIHYLTGEGSGPIASLLAIPQAMAEAIGWSGIGDPFNGLGLLSTISTGLDLDFLTSGLAELHSFLTDDLLNPVTDELSTLIAQLSDGLTDALGADLGVQATADMLLGLPDLLLTIAL